MSENEISPSEREREWCPSKRAREYSPSEREREYSPSERDCEQTGKYEFFVRPSHILTAPVCHDVSRIWLESFTWDAIVHDTSFGTLFLRDHESDHPWTFIDNIIYRLRSMSVWPECDIRPIQYCQIRSETSHIRVRLLLWAKIPHPGSIFDCGMLTKEVEGILCTMRIYRLFTLKLILGGIK